MPAQFFKPSRSLDGSPMAPWGRPYISSATFLIGAPLVTGSTGEVDEWAGGTDATPILGISGQPVDSTPGFKMQNSPTIITGRTRNMPVWLGRSNLLFSGSGVNGATDPVLPLLTHIGEEYSLLKDANGIWRIDFADTTTKIVHIEGIDAGTYTFFWRFLTSVIEA